MKQRQDARHRELPTLRPEQRSIIADDAEQQLYFGISVLNDDSTASK